MLKVCVVVLTIITIPGYLCSQNSVQDCSGAIPVCGLTTIDAYSGLGDMDDFLSPQSSSGCLGGEINSVWLIIQIDESSAPGNTLTMLITPKNGLAADYDWAIYGPNAPCGILGMPVRCSAAPGNCFYCPGTGIAGGQGFPLNSEDKASGDGLLPLLSTKPGDVYYICVNNYDDDPGGFSIQFGGTAILDCDPNPPCVMQVSVSPDVTVCQGEAGTFQMHGSEIGGGGLVDWLWTADPAIAVNFLDNPNIADPSVTIPPSFSGPITYTLTVTNPACFTSKKVKVYVTPTPLVTLDPIPQDICSSADPIQLNFSPPGGYFDAFGPIDNGFLDPSQWGGGIFNIKYTVPFGNGCVGDNEITINILNAPLAQIDQIDDFCVTDPVYQVLAYDTGGKWSGNGVNAKGEIDPKKLGPGTFSAIYTTDNGVCKTKDEVLFKVNPLPNVKITDPGPICNDTILITLKGSPAKGKWSGLPDSLGKFNPNITKPGTYKAFYSYTDLFGCKNKDSVNIKINPAPFAVITPSAQVCNSNQNGNTSLLDFSLLISAGDAGGSWQDIDGSGATGTFPVLDFLNAAPGKYNFTYTTNSALPGCDEVSYTIEVEVVDCKCPALFLTPSTILCNDLTNYDLSNLKLNTNDGTWSIINTPPGSNPALITGNNINIQNKDTGNYTIEFKLVTTPPPGCDNTNTTEITLHAPPVLTFAPTKTVCNKILPGSSPVTLDLDTYITSPDKSGIWTEITSSGASGTMPFLDFTGVTPGTYTFSYTTNSALAPCTETTKTVDVIVQDCECPSLALTKQLELCNDGTTYDLNLQKITTEPGSWTLKQTPPGVNPISLTGSIISISNKDAGNYIFSFTLANNPPAGCANSDDITVSLFDSPEATVLSTAEVCNSNSSGNTTILNFNDFIISGSKTGVWLDLNGSGASGSFNSKDFTGVMPGNYTFSYTTNTANFPCTDKTYNIIITVNDCNCPGLGLIKSTSICNEGNTQIDLNNLKITSESGNWAVKSKPTGNPANLTGSLFDVSNAATGNYVITFTLQNTPPPGCPLSADLTIEVLAPPVATLNNTVSVCNSTGSGQYSTVLNLYNQITAGDKSGSFEDTDNSGAKPIGNQLDFTGVAPGNYSFTYTTNSATVPCSESSYTIEVIVEDCECPSVATKNPGNFCSDDADYNLDNIKLTNEAGTWSIISQPPGSNPANIVGNMFEGTDADPGNYTILFTLNTTPPPGCASSSQQSFKISESLTAGNTPQQISICANDAQLINLNASLQGASPNGIWTEISANPSKNNVQNIQNGFFDTKNQATGLYQLEYKVVPAMPCTPQSVVLSIIINENPVADAGPDKLITCAEPSVSIGSNNSTTGAGISYNWSGNVTNAKSLTTQTAVPGIYQLTVTNTSTTCFSTDNVTVTLANDLPLPSNLEIDSINCFGQSDAKIKFDNIQGGTSPYTVFLNNVDFGSAQYFTKLPPGTYELKISDANGCTSTQTITITEPEKIYLELGSDVTVELGDSVHIEPFINIPLSNIDTIIWTPLINGPNGVCAGCFDHVLYPYYTTPLEMLVIDNKGCRVSDQMHITVDVVRQIFFPNIFSPNEDALNERFYPFADDRVVKIHEFRVFDRWGNMVFEQTNFLPNDYDKGWDGTRNGKHLNAGVYVYYAVVEFRDGAKKVFKGDVTLVH